MNNVILQHRLILAVLLLFPLLMIAYKYGVRRKCALSAWRRHLTRPGCAAALALGLIAIGQWMLWRTSQPPDGLPPALILVAMGAPCLWWAWRARRFVGTPEVWARGDTVVSSPTTHRMLVGLAFWVGFWLSERVSPNLLTGIKLGPWELIPAESSTSYAEQMALWGASIGLFVAGTVPWADFVALGRAARRDRQTHRLDWLLVLTCIAVGLALRLMALETTIPLVFGDEASFARQAASLFGNKRILFAPAHLSHPWLYSAALAPFVTVMGHSLTAIRMFSALCGVATIPAVYLLAREMFDRWVAATAAVFLTGWSVHVHFSRIALNNIVDPLCGALALAFLLRAFRQGHRLSYVLSGLALGISQYFYVGARLYPLLLTAYVLLLALLYRQEMRKHWRGLLVTAAAAFLVTLPANYWLHVNGKPLSRRPNAVSILTPRDDLGGRSQLRQVWEDERADFGQYVGKQIEGAFLAYTYRRDLSGYYGGKAAMFLPVAAVPFLLGVFGALWRWRRRAELLLLLLTGSTSLLGGALMFAPPHYTRYLVAIPALVILLALGLVQGLRFIAVGQRRSNLMALGLAGLLAAGSSVYYFDAHLDVLLDSFHPRFWQIYAMAQYIRDLPPGVPAYIINADEIDLYAQETIGYISYDRTVGYRRYEGLNWGIFENLPPGEHVLLISPRIAQEAEPILQSILPGGEMIYPDAHLRKGDAFIIYRVQR